MFSEKKFNKKPLESGNDQLCTNNFTIKHREGLIEIDVDESETSTIYLILLTFFVLDTLDLLVAIQINLLYLGIVSTIIDIIILVFLYSGYANYKDLKVFWKFNKIRGEVEVIRKSSRVNEQNILGISRIESFTMSENLYLNERFFISLVTKDKKRYKICHGNKNDCYDIAEKLSNFLSKPLIERNYFKLSIIAFSSILLIMVIITLIFIFLISVLLILEYMLYIIFKTSIILLSLRVIYLVREYFISKKKYEKDLIHYKMYQ